jgi:hypothetical protein
MAINAALTSLTWKGVAVPAVGSASISISRPALDITPIGTPTQQYIAGVSGATATLDLFFDEGDAPHFTMLTDINTATAAGSLVITLEANTTVTGEAFVTSYEITAQAQSVVRANVQFQYTTAPSSSATPVSIA